MTRLPEGSILQIAGVFWVGSNELLEKVRCVSFRVCFARTTAFPRENRGMRVDDNVTRGHPQSETGKLRTRFKGHALDDIMYQEQQVREDAVSSASARRVYNLQIILVTALFSGRAPLSFMRRTGVFRASIGLSFPPSTRLSNWSKLWMLRL